MTGKPETQPLIRKASKEDRPACQALIHAAWATAYRDIFRRETIDRAFTGDLKGSADWDKHRSKPLGVHVAELGAIVGTSSLSLLKDGNAELVTIYVNPDHQGKGIGRLLWNNAVEIAKSAGCAYLHVWTLAKGPAVSFYPRMGCERIGTGVFALGDEERPAIGFRLALGDKQGARDEA